MALYSIARGSTSDLDLSRPPEKELPIVPAHIRIFTILLRKCKALVRHWWAWDYLAAATSVVAMIILIITLAENDGQLQQSFWLGAVPISLNALVAAISTVMRTSLAVTVAGALNQSSWNWFSSSVTNKTPQPSKPLKDLDVFGDASSDSWSSLKLLYRTKGK